MNRDSIGHVSLVLAAIFCGAFALRLGLTATLQGLAAPPKVEANPDQREYELIAYNLSAGNGYGFTRGKPTAARPPGTPLTFLPPYLLFGRSYLAERSWIILLSSATCLLVAWLGTLYGGPRLGLVAAAWLALYPGHFYYSMHFLSETVYGFWLALACGLCLYSIRTGRRWADIGAGLAWAFAILTRVELILLVPIAWALLRLASAPTRGQAVRHLAVHTTLVLVVVSIWVGRNIVVMGVPSLSTQRGFAFWGAHNTITMSDPAYAGSWVSIFEQVRDTQPLNGTEVERDRQAWNNGVAAVHENLPRLPYLTVMKLWRLISPFFETSNRIALWAVALGWIVTAPFLLYGVWLIVRDWSANSWVWMVLLAPMMATIAMAAVFYGSARFRDALSPLFVVIAASGALRLKAHFLPRPIVPRHTGSIVR